METTYLTKTKAARGTVAVLAWASGWHGRQKDGHQMQKIIDGVLYDTDKGKPICDLGQYLHWDHAILYRTASSRFYLFVKSYETMSIEPQPEDEAKKLVEQFSTVEMWKELFGEPQEA
jgi:hypothetical protein